MTWWTCQCGQWTWNTRNKCHSCGAARVQDGGRRQWGGWNQAAAGRKQANWKKQPVDWNGVLDGIRRLAQKNPEEAQEKMTAIAEAGKPPPEFPDAKLPGVRAKLSMLKTKKKEKAEYIEKLHMEMDDLDAGIQEQEDEMQRLKNLIIPEATGYASYREAEELRRKTADLEELQQLVLRGAQQDADHKELLAQMVEVFARAQEADMELTPTGSVCGEAVAEVSVPTTSFLEQTKRAPKRRVIGKTTTPTSTDPYGGIGTGEAATAGAASSSTPQKARKTQEDLPTNMPEFVKGSPLAKYCADCTRMDKVRGKRGVRESPY